MWNVGTSIYIASVKRNMEKYRCIVIVYRNIGI